MSSEKNLWRWLSKARITLRDKLHIIRVENHIISGVPDVEGCYDGEQFWIELKSIKKPIREKTLLNVKFRPAQIPWLLRREKANGKAGVLFSITDINRNTNRYYIAPSYLHYLQRKITMLDLSDICHKVPKLPDVFIKHLCALRYKDI